MDRRKFIKNSIAAGTILQLEVNPKLVGKLQPIVLATNWGYNGAISEFCGAAKKEGYDGIELWWNADSGHQKELFAALEKHDLQIGYLVAGLSPTFTEHFAEFKKNLGEALSSTIKPLYINCHSGKDYFELDENGRLVEHTISEAQRTGIEITHETHRSRMCFAAPVTKKLLDKFDGMHLTLDISHWTNVHESLLEDQQENVRKALAHTRHVHLRVGHQEGPQVSDPRAPEWDKALQAHLKWWDEVVENRISAGADRLTFLTEFGPPSYMPTLPYTRQPLANQWEINVFMKNLIKQRYQ